MMPTKEVFLTPPTFEPARTTDPTWSISEAEIGTPLNAGTPYAFKPSLDAPSAAFGGNRVGAYNHDVYLRLIPFPKPPVLAMNPSQRDALKTYRNYMGPSRVGGPSGAPSG